MRILTRVLIFASLLLASASVYGQNNVDDMKRQREELRKQIDASEKMLSSTNTDINVQVANLNVISARLKERQKLLAETRRQISEFNKQSAALTVKLKQMESEYKDCQDKYSEACRFYQKRQNSFNPLLFIFSSDDYQQLTRRIRYIKEYSVSLDELGSQIESKKNEIEQQKAEIEKLKNEKLALQEQQLAEQKEIQKEEKSQKSIVNKLKSKRSGLQKEIKRQQNEMTALGKEIDRQIQLALQEESKPAKSGGKQSSSNLKPQTAEDIKLSGSFESNKGKLPIPITGPYLIVGNYGVQNVAGMKDVKLNNLGIDIQGENGAKARAVFDGTVSTVFGQGKGQIGILVRHGKYISVYCNLSSADVQKGDKVKTGQSLGSVAVDTSGRTLLHFQLHSGTQKMNPTPWLRH